MIAPGAGAAGTLSDARNHCATASADTAATVSTAFFRDASICKILGKFPSRRCGAIPADARDDRTDTRLATYYGRTLMTGTAIR